MSESPSSQIEAKALVQEAVNLKASGKYNCAQAVACAFAPVIGADKEQIYNAANAFGHGMGCLEATCGALVGAGLIIGTATKDRVKSMKGVSVILKRFEERNGSTICKKLKGINVDPETGAMTAGKPLRACNLCVADSAEFLADFLSVNPIGQSDIP